MELPKNYNPQIIEDKWYKKWTDQNLFHSEPDSREPYTIVIPPPNVTGVLHMGHMLNNTLQDVLIRRARMLGKNALWVPGTDHASIATESKVVAKLKDEGIKKEDLSREEFIEQAWKWTEKHGGIILEQLKKLGASCDWNRTCFTMDEIRYESVIDVFIDLYKKGYIYRGHRMVNWDPKAKTALSDEEVIFKEVRSKLYFIKYKLSDSDDYLTIATTRPETLLGDTAVCVNPNDSRYIHLVNKKVVVPLVNRLVPVISDEYVDIEFGTGALKVTPAHDINDYVLGQKFNLPFIDIFNDDGTLSTYAELFIGEDRFIARKKVVKALEENGQLLKIEDYTNKIGFSERTDEIIEPKISLQWFMRMQDIAKPAIDHVKNGDITFHPHKFVNSYMHWMENIKDWCISRQLWWGHRIPAFYLSDGTVIVAKSIDDAVAIAREKTGNDRLKMNDLKQDEDVLDTWFSSWLWPINVFDGIRKPNNPEFTYYYPTNDLITAPDIIFFWVARMIMAGYEYPGQKPFKDVYYTGMVRDKQRRKMSKSLGNSPEPIDLIEKFGADGVRIGMLFSSPAGNDLLFDESLCEQGRNFNNKIWNAFRLVQGFQNDTELTQPEHCKIAIRWFDAKLNQAIHSTDDLYGKYRLSDVLITLYKLFWDDFSSIYLELIKPPYQQKLDQQTYDSTLLFFEKLLKLLHPFIPFITEELYNHLNHHDSSEFIMISAMPKAGIYDKHVIKNLEHTAQVITAVREFRKNKELSSKENLPLLIKKDKFHKSEFDPVILKLGNVGEIEYVEENPDKTYSFLIGKTHYFIPITTAVDVDEEIAKIEKDLAYYQGFLAMTMKKLDNESFVKNAPPQVVEIEMKKKTDTLHRIKLLEEKLNELKP
jgi:valyl-tRNA synthetase